MRRKWWPQWPVGALALAMILSFFTFISTASADSTTPRGSVTYALFIETAASPQADPCAGMMRSDDAYNARRMTALVVYDPVGLGGLGSFFGAPSLFELASFAAPQTNRLVIYDAYEGLTYVFFESRQRTHRAHPNLDAYHPWRARRTAPSISSGHPSGGAPNLLRAVYTVAP